MVDQLKGVEEGAVEVEGAEVGEDAVAGDNEDCRILLENRSLFL